MNIQEILDDSMGKKVSFAKSGFLSESYNHGRMDETISRIDKKLEDICKELKNLNIILGEL